MSQDANITEILLNRAEAGNRAAIDELMEVHRVRLKKMFRVRLSDWMKARVDASDLVQETLVEASQNLEKYLHNRPIGFYPWLRQIAVQRLSKARNFHRAQKRNAMREAQPLDLSNQSAVDLAKRLVSELPSPSALALEAERAEAIRAVIEQLPATYREILTLRYLEELSVDECLEVLDISLQAYKKRHFRAAKQLRERLAEQNPMSDETGGQL
jgi:RNA polymerase sigma-70 factor (ECF subfamily)